MSILVICQMINGPIAVNDLKAITAAQYFLEPITLFIISSQHEKTVSTVSSYPWIKKAYRVNCAGSPENCVHTIVALQKKNNFTTIIAADNSFTKQILPQIAALCDADMLTGITEIIDSCTYKRPVFAGDFIATVQLHTSIKIMSICASAFEKPTSHNDQPLIQIEWIDFENKNLVDYQIANRIKPMQDVTTADMVIGGGRGLGSAKHFHLLEQLAKTFSACVGATRAAVDAGWVNNSLQIGQTGKIIAPKLYIAIGISGAVQHLAGIKGSKTIIAINTDPNAPIMQFADYTYEGDLFEVIPKLIELNFEK